MRRAARLLFVGVGWLSFAAFFVGLLMAVLTLGTKASPWYEVGAALLFGGLGVILLIGTVAWALAEVRSHPVGPSALVGLAGTVSLMLGVAALMLALVVGVVRGERVIDGDEPALRISFGLLGLGLVLIGLAPPPSVAARIASSVAPIAEWSPRMGWVSGWFLRAVCAASGVYLVWRVALA